MAPLRPIDVGDEYGIGEWPLHVTVVGNFGIGCDDDEVMALIDDTHPDSAIQVGSVSRAMYGPEADVAVTVLADSPELRERHDVLLDILVGAGAVLDDPQYAADGYRPHVTDTPDGGIPVGEVVSLDSLALIDLQPHGRVDRRRIVGVRSFVQVSGRA